MWHSFTVGELLTEDLGAHLYSQAQLHGGSKGIININLRALDLYCILLFRFTRKLGSIKFHNMLLIPLQRSILKSVAKRVNNKLIALFLNSLPIWGWDWKADVFVHIHSQGCYYFPGLRRAQDVILSLWLQSKMTHHRNTFLLTCRTQVTARNDYNCLWHYILPCSTPKACKQKEKRSCQAEGTQHCSKSGGFSVSATQYSSQNQSTACPATALEFSSVLWYHSRESRSLYLTHSGSLDWKNWRTLSGKRRLVC